jgi:hypothetical protein
MSEIYAKHDGTMEEMLRIIRTATDWQATHIILVGAHGVAALAPELHSRWAEYQIPMSVAETPGEVVDEETLIQPPFEGLRAIPEDIAALLETNEAVVFNGVLRTARAVEKSDVI